jgi:hypothetical protein
VAARLRVPALLEEPVEDEAAVAARVPVEPERELVQVGVEVLPCELINPRPS